MVFHWSLSDSKSPQVSRTLLSILAVLNYAVVWMVSTRPSISESSSPFCNPLVTVPNAPITIYHYYYFYSLEFFLHQRKLMVFHWRLSDSKSPQVSRTLLSILAVLNYAVVWMVSTRPSISEPSSPFCNPLVTVPKAPITIGIIVTFIFHSFFNSLARSRYLSLFSHSFSFILWSAGTAKSTILQIFFSFFFLLL